MNKSFNIFLWVLFFMLMAPSGMVLASWNAVPGDATYSWKTGMENILVTILPSQKLKSATHLKLTERRMGEVSKVLSGTHAREGLINLNKQISTTQTSLKEIRNPEERAQAVALYIQTLNQVSTQLETEKQSRAVGYLPPNQATASDYDIKNLRPQRNNPTNNNYNPPPDNNNYQQPTNNNNNQPQTNNNNYQPPTNNQAPTLQPTTKATTKPTSSEDPVEDEDTETIEEEIVEEIGDTQDEIEGVIEELEKVLEEANQESPNSAGMNQMNAATEDAVNEINQEAVKAEQEIERQVQEAENQRTEREENQKRQNEDKEKKQRQEEALQQDSQQQPDESSQQEQATEEEDNS